MPYDVFPSRTKSLCALFLRSASLQISSFCVSMFLLKLEIYNQNRCFPSSFRSTHISHIFTVSTWKFARVQDSQTVFCVSSAMNPSSLSLCHSNASETFLKSNLSTPNVKMTQNLLCCDTYLCGTTHCLQGNGPSILTACCTESDPHPEYQYSRGTVQIKIKFTGWQS